MHGDYKHSNKCIIISFFFYLIFFVDKEEIALKMNKTALKLFNVAVVGLSGVEKDNLKHALDNIISDNVLESQKLRAHVMDYHDIKFKAQMKRTLDKVYHDIHKSDVANHPSDCSECK